VACTFVCQQRSAEEHPLTLALIAYLVACLFLGVVDSAIDTIMVCFCWEQDANGQMEDAEGNKMVYGTKELIQYIDGAKDLAKNLEGGATVAPAPGDAPAAEAAPVAAPAETAAS
jgi:hypothetical protein